MPIDFSLNGVQSLLISLAILLAPVPHFWSLLVFFLVAVKPLFRTSDRLRQFLRNMSSEPTEMNELNGLNWCQGLLLDPSMGKEKYDVQHNSNRGPDQEGPTFWASDTQHCARDPDKIWRKTPLDMCHCAGKARTINIILSIFPAGRSLFSDLLRDSSQAFEAGDSNDTITVFMPGLHKQAWAYPSEFDRRLWESIHLPAKDELLRDILNFEGRGDFYQRHRTGKTSLVKALAGHRKRALYIINLGDEGLTDGALRTLLERVPRSSMILIEDLTGLSTLQKGDCVQSMTLPGLLNALDGVTAPERGVWVFDTNCGRSPGLMTMNRTFFVTTNDIAGLDPVSLRRRCATSVQHQRWLHGARQSRTVPAGPASGVDNEIAACKSSDAFKEVATFVVARIKIIGTT
ncbi:hypothetical protein B0H13DRAFT_1882404 [Mycena leptocephala]|nr:hypothetical protein B0H13DRAFT_1882404 [Mycena leptocephala]